MEIGKMRTGSELDMLVDFLGIDDILDFSNDDIGGPIQNSCSAFTNHVNGSSFSSSTSSPSSYSSSLEERKEHLQQREDVSYDHHLCLPCDEIAELEWLSMFVEESFSAHAGDTQFLSPHNDILSPQNNSSSTASERRMKEEMKEEEENMINMRLIKQSEALVFHSRSPMSVLEMGRSSSSSSSSSTSGCVKEKVAAVPGRARSKRPRGSVTKKGVAGWNILSSRRILLNSTNHSDYSTILAPAHKPNGAVEVGVVGGAISRSSSSDESRRCLHCGSQKTPQWRAGPLGPKTLCNACGVRFKSGRLLPEYRPASSPTFVDSIHSNSHKKVLEMRRTKEGIISSPHYNSTPHSVNMNGFSCRDEEWTLLSHN